MAETGFDELQDQWENDEQRLKIRVVHLEESEIEKTFKELRGDHRQAPPKWLQKPVKNLEAEESREEEILDNEREDTLEEAAAAEGERQKRKRSITTVKPAIAKQKAKAVKKTVSWADQEIPEEHAEEGAEEEEAGYPPEEEECWAPPPRRKPKGGFSKGKGKGKEKGKDKGKGKGKSKAKGKSKGAKGAKGKDKFAGFCHNCGKIGHRAFECWS